MDEDQKAAENKDSVTKKRTDGFHVATPPSFVPQQPPNQANNQVPPLSGLPQTGPPTQASTPPNTDLKVQRMSQQPSMNIYVSQALVRAPAQNFYSRAPPLSSQTPRMANHRQGQQPIYQTQPTQFVPMALQPTMYHLNTSTPVQYFNGAPRPQTSYVAPGYQMIPSQTITYQYPQAPSQPQAAYFYNASQLLQRSPPRVASATQTPTVSLAQPTQQHGSLTKTKRRCRAIPIIDVNTGKDKLNEMYEQEQDDSHPLSGELSPGQTPQPPLPNPNKELQAAFAKQLAQAIGKDEASAMEELEEPPVLDHMGHTMYQSPLQAPPDPLVQPSQSQYQAKNKANATTSAEVISGNPESKLNLPYRDDQWSPFNRDGKKVYDKDFLLALRKDPKSNKKPDNLPANILANDDKGRVGDIARATNKSSSQRDAPPKRKSQKSKSNVPVEVPKPQETENARGLVNIAEKEKVKDTESLSIIAKRDEKDDFEQLESLSKNILEEYLNNRCNLQECEQYIKASISLSALPQLVSDGYISVLERSKAARLRTGFLFTQLIKSGTLSMQNYCAGLTNVLEEAEELIFDVPSVWDDVAELIFPVLCEVVTIPVHAHMLFDLLITKSPAAKLLSFLFKMMIQEKNSNLQSTFASYTMPLIRDKPLGPIQMFGNWNRGSNTKTTPQPHVTNTAYMYAALENMGTERDKRSALGVLQRNTMYTPVFKSQPPASALSVPAPVNLTLSPVSQSHSLALGQCQLPYEEIHNKLLAFFKSGTSFDDTTNWIAANVGERVKENQFIRTLATACFEDSIVNFKLKADILQGKCNLLHRFVDNKLTYELQCLYALQALINKLEHPQGLLLAICDKLYEEYVFSHESFVAWEASKNPAEQKGKDLALKQLTNFFTRLKEADEDSSSSEYSSG